MNMQKTCTAKLRRYLVLSLAVLLAAGLSLAGITSARERTISQDSRRTISGLSEALSEIADLVRPAVVNISTTSVETIEDNPFGDLFNDPLFRRFFGDRFGGGQPGQKRKFRSSALGSGVIVSEQGYILTNNHLVKGAEEITVILYDKREFKGKVVGTDSRTDLAVVKINGKDLPTLTLGDSARMKTGDIVLAVGNPFGLNQTITMGIVSAVGRSDVGIADFEDFIQTDAAINPGNSGGALVNGSGELVGINTAIFSTSGGYMGVGFAIPSNMAKTVMDSIIKHGKVIRGWLGVSVQSLTPELAKSLGIRDASGALIAGVENGSPAEKAGLKRGDLVVSVGTTRTAEVATFRNMVAAAAPGAAMDFKIIRNGKERTITVTLGEYREKKIVKKVAFNNLLKGVTVQELIPSLRDKLELPEDLDGVAITDVASSSPVKGILQVNDVIQEVNRAAIRSANEFTDIVSKIGKNDTLLLLVYRDGESGYLTIEP